MRGGGGGEKSQSHNDINIFTNSFDVSPNLGISRTNTLFLPEKDIIKLAIQDSPGHARTIGNCATLLFGLRMETPKVPQQYISELSTTCSLLLFFFKVYSVKFCKPQYFDLQYYYIIFIHYTLYLVEPYLPSATADDDGYSR